MDFLGATVKDPSLRGDRLRAAASRVSREAAPHTVELSPRQWQVFTDPHRFRIVIAGRRSGKTVEAVTEALTACIQKPNTNAAYIAPTYRMARDIAWEMALQTVPERYLLKDPNESRLEILLRNGSRLVFKGAERPARLKGIRLDFAVLDEWAQQRENVWTEAIYPTLATTGGRALFITTPMGFNHAHAMWERAQRPENLHLWGAHQYTTAEGGWVTIEELAIAMGEMDARIFRQEFLASFETLFGRVYGNFNRADHHSRDIEDPAVALRIVNTKLADRGARTAPLPPLYVGMDFNVNPMTAVVGYARVKGHLDICDEFVIPDANTETMSRAIRDKYGETRRIIVCPDPAGNQRHSNAPLGETDLTILRRHGFELSLPDQQIRVPDRINAVQALLRAANGQVRMRVHPRCEKLTTALEGLTYKEGTSRPDPKSPHIHITDALGYLVWNEFNTLEHAQWLTARFKLT